MVRHCARMSVNGRFGYAERERVEITLLGDIESTRPVWIVISTTEELAQDGIVPACPMSAIGHVRALRNAQGVEGNEVGRYVRLLDALGLDVPAGEIVLEHAYETLFGVVAVLRATGGRWG